MKHELVQLKEQTGMKLGGQNSQLSGFYQGFAVVTRLNSKARCYDVLVWATRPGDDASPEVNRWLEDYSRLNPDCTGGSYDGVHLVVHLAMAKKRDDTAASLLRFYQDVTAWLGANGFATVCEPCGSSSPDLYSLGGQFHVICPQCLDKMTQEAKAAQKATPGNLPAGVVGALLFSLAGVALWVLVNRLGYVAAICGLVLVVCAFKGYEKFGKKMDMPAIFACILVSLFMGLVAQYLCLGLDIYSAFSAEYDITLLDALRSIPNFLEDPELLGAYGGDLLMGYLFMAVGSYSFVRNALRAQRHGGFLVEKLADNTSSPAMQ